ncbi:MAG: isoleucyl-tRNA synthetase, partial [Patescibacteria group bacterium]|nr:isoleucyl-tRNA synthetase [Patescibacteria group bacterium]
MQPNSNNKKTINEKELEILKYWEDNKIFEQSVKHPASNNSQNNEKGKKRKDFSFYDGPPFATGLPHAGHILAGTIKDSIPRYHTMQGSSVRRVWGWDCHGLPIENLVEKEFGLNSKKEIEEFGIGKFNKAAADSVLTYEHEWKKIVPRLGRWVDMENSYKTMDSTFTESVWWAWKELYDKGLAYEGFKMMHICPRCETPLAQSEVGLEYHEVTDMSVTAEFELVDEEKTYVLAWTTTPWTLPGNTALAVNKSIDYIKVKSLKDSEVKNFILAKSKFEEYKNYAKDYQEFEIVEEFKGDKLIGKKYKPVFDYYNNPESLNKIEHSENIWKIWHADFINDESGTGIAHEAPAFGADDMELAKENNIPIIKHVLMNGSFTKEIKDFEGLVVKKKDDTMSTDIEIVKWLAHNGKLFEKHKIVHSYPLCWRCKTPLLNYATSSWFVDVPSIKNEIVSENQKVAWVPEHIKDGRMGKWLEGAKEWAVSRSRYWGAPMPIWKNADGSEVKIIGSIKEIATSSNNDFYVMRHGESFSNVNMIIDNGNDLNNHLTEEGKVQVENAIKEFKEKLGDKKIDLIISSPIVRTRETSVMVSQALDLEFIVDDRLREFDHGDYDGRTLEYFYEKEGKEKYLKLNSRPKGGESHQDMMNRTMSLLEELDKENKGKSILLVTHGGPMRMITAGAELVTEEKILEDEISHDIRLYPHNAEIRKLNYLKVPRDETGAINLHKPYIDKVVLKDKNGEEMKIIGDVFDCWFESGSMPYAQLHYPFENKEIFKKNFPADFIAEGMDQTRGWFYSLLNLGTGLFDESPYKHVIVNGTILAADGQKMSKSLKNYTDP